MAMKNSLDAGMEHTSPLLWGQQGFTNVSSEFLSMYGLSQIGDLKYCVRFQAEMTRQAIEITDQDNVNTMPEKSSMAMAQNDDPWSFI